MGSGLAAKGHGEVWGLDRTVLQLTCGGGYVTVYADQNMQNYTIKRVSFTVYKLHLHFFT